MEDQKKLIKGCAAGKRKAQEQLYKMFAPKMFAVCLYMSKDQTEAEDILQEGFIKVFNHIKNFRSEGSLEGWVRRIIVNVALEHFRKHHHLYPISEAEKMQDMSYDDVVDQMSAADLMKLIQGLTPQYKIVFTLYAIEGYSHKEIAEMLEITEGTSKSNLSRARKILQDKVNELYHYTAKPNLAI